MSTSSIQRVLITGGAGFIGSNLIRLLRREEPWDVRVVDDLRAGTAGYLDGEAVDLRVGGAADPQVLEPALQGVDAVVHLASQTGVAPSVENPAGDFMGNPSVTVAVLDACRRQGVERFVFASSGAAVGEVPPPIHEEVVPHPVSPYGAGKLAGEAYCSAFAASFGMSAVALRFSNVYGPFSTHKRNAVPNFIKAGLSGRPVTIFGDGGQTRDFIFVEDLCRAILLALTTGGVAGEVFQVATGVETSITDLAKLALAATGSQAQVLHEPRRAGDVYRSAVDISKIRRALSFEPAVDLVTGLSRTASWYRDHWSSDRD